MIPIHLSPAEIIQSPERAPEPVEGIEAKVTRVAEDAAEKTVEVATLTKALTVVVTTEVATSHDFAHEEFSVLYIGFT